ncbi:TetR family transcriptional regulator [Orenia metallireducens]|uniref:Transcriptional regulator, TetR family n=1 Tax=Orenia metallireducens TaxID=1413210 RepID=A0A285F424_9FIRM|nr:TetR/AcrR family transcriptional regulator [Orenia metallireducens]PRX34749.1 TetR family transcriptional regulator [Orenia metallireducens]SNY05474.1 transcriptional regulator, TetR family [Orenia metallireducens]
MPTDTFFNLPQEKQDRIIAVAIDEFANYAYHNSTINRIVEKAEIAKGSFYQYFNGKKDLFKYIMLDIIGKRKLEYLDYMVENMDKLNFFHHLRELYLGGVKFAKDNPKLQAIATKFIKDSSNDLKKEILGETAVAGNDFMKELLVKGVKEAEIKPDLNIDVIVFILIQFNFSAFEFLFNKIEVWDEEQIVALIDDLLYIVENGIKNKNY